MKVCGAYLPNKPGDICVVSGLHQVARYLFVISCWRLTGCRFVAIQRDIQSWVFCVPKLDSPPPKLRFLGKMWVVVDIVGGLICLRVDQAKLFFVFDEFICSKNLVILLNFLNLLWCYLWFFIEMKISL